MDLSKINLATLFLAFEESCFIHAREGKCFHGRFSNICGVRAKGIKHCANCWCENLITQAQNELNGRMEEDNAKSKTSDR